MSLSESEERIPAVNQGSSIPELIKYIKHSFRECKFNEVQNILIDREKKMKMEIENLTRNRDSLEKTQGLAELKKLKLGDELRKSGKECEKLKETITRLTEEQRVSSEKAKKAEECCTIASKKNVKIVKEKDELIAQLNQEIDQLKNKNLESQQLLKVNEEKLKIADMRFKKAYKQAAHHISMYHQRIEKMETALAKHFNVKVEDLGNLAEISYAAANGESVDLPDVAKGGKDSVANGVINGDVKDMAVVSPRVHSASNSVGSGGIGSQNKGCRNLVHSSEKEDDTNEVQTSPGTEPGRGHSHVGSDGDADAEEGEEPLVSGSHSNGLHIKDKAPIADIIVICDSDEESNPDEAINTASDQINKRKREDSPLSFIAKRNRGMSIGEDEPFDDKKIQILESSNDVDSDDESCSDGRMEDLVATVRNKCSGTKR